MSTPHLGAEQLELLGEYNTPTISNAIELFDVRPRHTGYLPHFIRCLLPELGVIVGYAVTCQTTAAPPEAGATEADLLADYLRYVAAEPGPKIAVGEDIDDPPGLGRPVRGGHGDDPSQARLRRPHHQRLSPRP